MVKVPYPDCVLEPRVGIDFFPLLIDYEERMSSIGRIPGGYNRSEGKASDKAILISRLIDRPIRPLFPKGYRNDIQIVAQLFSYDQQNQPDTLAMLGASCALMLSGAPFEGPIGAVRVSRDENGNMIANPTHQEADKSDLDIVVAGTHIPASGFGWIRVLDFEKSNWSWTLPARSFRKTGRPG